jgi:hypothetical protein
MHAPPAPGRRKAKLPVVYCGLGDADARALPGALRAADGFALGRLWAAGVAAVVLGPALARPARLAICRHLRTVRPAPRVVVVCAESEECRDFAGVCDAVLRAPVDQGALAAAVAGARLPEGGE